MEFRETPPSMKILASARACTIVRKGMRLVAAKYVHFLPSAEAAGVHLTFRVERVHFACLHARGDVTTIDFRA